MVNVYKKFLAILPDDPLLVGTVAAVYSDDMVDVTLTGGGTIRVSGTAAVGSRVFVQGGSVQGPAPDLPLVNVTLY